MIRPKPKKQSKTVEKTWFDQFLAISEIFDVRSWRVQYLVVRGTYTLFDPKALKMAKGLQTGLHGNLNLKTQHAKLLKLKSIR